MCPKGLEGGLGELSGWREFDGAGDFRDAAIRFEAVVVAVGVGDDDQLAGTGVTDQLFHACFDGCRGTDDGCAKLAEDGGALPLRPLVIHGIDGRQ